MSSTRRPIDLIRSAIRWCLSGIHSTQTAINSTLSAKNARWGVLDPLELQSFLLECSMRGVRLHRGDAHQPPGPCRLGKRSASDSGLFHAAALSCSHEVSWQ